MNKQLISMTAVAAMAGAALAVESKNVVGYKDEAFNGDARYQSVQFLPIGGDVETAFNLTNVIDASSIADYADELQIFDPVSGDMITYLWDAEKWIDAATDEPLDVMVVPGSAFMCVADAWRFAGQVPTTGTIEIAVTPGEGTLVGGGLPIDATVANFDWTSIADYADELQLYDPESGDDITYLWDGTQWIDAGSDEPLDFDTVLPGFIIITDQESITERVTPYDYGA